MIPTILCNHFEVYFHLVSCFYLAHVSSCKVKLVFPSVQLPYGNDDLEFLCNSWHPSQLPLVKYHEPQVAWITRWVTKYSFKELQWSPIYHMKCTACKWLNSHWGKLHILALDQSMFRTVVNVAFSRDHCLSWMVLDTPSQMFTTLPSLLPLSTWTIFILSKIICEV